MPKFRTITGQFVGYIPDSIDSDIVPDRAPMNGRVTFTPVFTGGVIAFPELMPPEFAHPRTIHARIVDGFVQVEVNEGEGDDEQIVLQPLTLMVTVDDEASQVWSWRADFSEILIGASDEYVKIPAWSFRVPDGTGPVDLTELVPLKTGGSVDVTKGPRGAGLQNITAVDGQLVFEYTDGEETTVPIPEAVQGPQGEPGPAGADGAQGPEGPQGPAGEIPDLLVGNITDATPTGKNLMLAATEGAARNALGLQAGATATNGSLEELNTGTSNVPRVWTANNLTGHMAENYVVRSGRRGVTRTIYVRADGSDSNNGRTESTAFREIRAAVDSLDHEMPDLRGSVVIDVGPGEYKGGIRLPNTRTPTQDNFVRIQGPSVGGHPNVPTATIRYSLDTTPTWAILAENGWWLWVQDIAIEGAFNTGLDCRSDVTLQRHNVHIDGCRIGVSATTRVMDNARGGVIQNCTLYGVQEMYGTIRTYGGGIGAGTIFRNNEIGLYSKSFCGGHLDHAEFEGNKVAVHVDRGGVNFYQVRIHGSTVCGIACKDTEIHNVGGIDWGTTNARRVLQWGPASNEADLWGWAGSNLHATRTGQPAPICIAQDYDSHTVNQTTSTQFTNFVQILPADRLCMKGRRLKVVIQGRLGNTLTAPASVRVLVGGTTFSMSTFHAGTEAGTFYIEAEVVCVADGNSQKTITRYSTQGKTAQATAMSTTKDLSTSATSVTVTGNVGAAGEILVVEFVELYM